MTLQLRVSCTLSLRASYLLALATAPHLILAAKKVKDATTRRSENGLHADAARAAASAISRRQHLKGFFIIMIELKR